MSVTASLEQPTDARLEDPVAPAETAFHNPSVLHTLAHTRAGVCGDMMRKLSPMQWDVDFGNAS